MHPLAQFRFCPKCGSPRFVENNFKSKKCEECNFIYYFNPSSATVAFIVNRNGELLVATRAFDPAKGTLDMPGGFVDLDESLEECVVREVEEETSLTVARAEYLFSIPNRYVYSDFEVQTVDAFFLCKVDDTGSFQAKDDVAKLEFVKIKDLDPNKFGLVSVRKGIIRAIDEGILK
ncbi:NAD+ diphosphatase [Dysgonomonas sp. PH5-45]|uniref:NUDIX hydrolase n=1 Tax=unclassified Dysgonomonas TaxID=2630389 RepID=UPI00247483CD|nr:MULTISPECIES: NUDIX domain-containing protein [unclassified Dysgonomonas]MDH6355506.1 NAD+ diphosphatase [Dysgonomonas sp. PH5-45]MDH6388433.1 NAD+ diphosphatase [Dysgonomonas sp. PH5-37]